MNGKAESETPRYDALYHNPLNSNDLRAWKKLAYDLERQHSLAQTEIKGHMRVEDELEAELAEAQAQLAAWQEHGKTYGFICGRFECDESGKYHIFQNEGLERK